MGLGYVHLNNGDLKKQNRYRFNFTIKLLKQETSWMKDKLLKCRALWDYAPVAQLDRVPGYELGI